MSQSYSNSDHRLLTTINSRVITMSLKELYQGHTGKVADKWESYLNFYERTLSPYKNKNIKMLEVGVQNGGSLEIWSKFFPNAEKIVGCDIEQKCSLLEYDDQRIELIIGDVCDKQILNTINEEFEAFDIIIDDGSHISSEIVQTFCNLFPKLADGGSYIIEDLHCSYWDRYQGGLYAPQSSLFFFKKLIDLINKEHWGVDKSTVEFLNVFTEQFKNTEIENLVEEIEFIEFANSVCLVKKKSNLTEVRGIGKRIICGEQAVVRTDAQFFRNTDMDIPDESSNFWSNLNSSIEEDWKRLQNTLSDSLRRLGERENEISQLKSSTSWKITTPLRSLKSSLGYYIPSLRAEFKEVKSLELPKISKHKLLPHTDFDSYQFESLKSSRVCVFAHYSPENKVSDHLLYYLASLKKHGFDIICVSTSQICSGDRDKLKNICNYLLVRPNIGYDFGSWQLGLKVLKQNNFIPEQVLIANDSVYGPFTDLDLILERSTNSSANIFGLTDSYEIDFHLQSYFILFDKSVICSETWENFWNNIGIYHSKKELVINCEVRLSTLLMQAGFKLDSYCRSADIAHQAITHAHPYRELLIKARAYNVTHLLWDVLIIDYNFPFIKRELVEKNPLRIKTLTRLKDVLMTTPYPTHLIEDINK